MVHTLYTNIILLVTLFAFLFIHYLFFPGFCFIITDLYCIKSPTLNSLDYYVGEIIANYLYR